MLEQVDTWQKEGKEFQPCSQSSDGTDNGPRAGKTPGYLKL